MELRLSVASVHEQGLDLRIDADPAILDIEGDAYLDCAEPVACRFRAERFGHELLVRGRIETRIGTVCSRCAVSFVMPVVIDAFACSFHIDDTCESVDLTPEVRESILLAFPTYPVCSPECRGLCARCGADLNETPCECDTRPVGRLGALDAWTGLTVQEEEGRHGSSKKKNVKK